ncbi:21587_t:CDS:10 [Cetraspora pellucida]|uniref:Ubiquitin carboxyl-terminal hydrolase n=1 Tax=Cetraspora pellucida TaxID=1433469 RepID=A0A9N9CBD2_9GLOM|nr:21587_t:CDS:10 [Cetraspora pellucida]
MSKRQYSDRSSSPANVSRKLACIHIERYSKQGSPVAKIESSAFKRQVSNSTLCCDWCETGIPRVWVCLVDVAPLFVVVVVPGLICVNIMIPHTSCAIALNPFNEDQEFSQETRNYLKTVVRCLQVKRNKSQHSIDQLTTDVPGLVGLKNLGNTCYASAALQCLSNTPALINYFNYCNAYIPRSLNIHTKNSKYRLAEPFSQFIEAMWSGTSPIFAPIRLINEIKRHNKIFQGHSQEDSAEFLHVILDKLHEELPYPQNMLNYSQTNGNTNNRVHVKFSPLTVAGVNAMMDDHYACGISPSTSSTSSTITLKHYERFQRRNSSPTSIISDIFQGVLESKIKCLHCMKDSIKEDYFYVLPIQIVKKYKLRSQEKNLNGALNTFIGSMGDFLGISGRTVKLQDCLAAFCATENLTGEDRYRCDGCKSLNDCQKMLRITRLPESLCIQIKRFRFESYFSSKIATHVQFPMEGLDMSPYCKGTNESSDNSKYSLYGLINHRGVIGGGHYVAYVKNPIDGNWYEFDDTYVTRKSATEISRLEAYVLFYKKTNPEKEQERQDILSQISDPGPIANYDFICSHGGVKWRLYHKLHDMVVRIPFNVYTLLMERYGTDGSPPFHADDYGRAGCKICEQEERILDQRRRKEARDINQIDTSVISHGPLPGAIDNTTFLQEDGRPKPGMKRATDYRAVNANVWNYFVHAYGGGPICIRGTIDLYSSPYSLYYNGN